jgi:predicted enzyme related to lactoylglutathione lyase
MRDPCDGLGFAGEAIRIGLHFAVSDLAAARAAIERGGGRTCKAVEVAPGVIVADATDTEGHGFTLALREGSRR